MLCTGKRSVTIVSVINREAEKAAMHATPACIEAETTNAQLSGTACVFDGSR